MVVDGEAMNMFTQKPMVLQQTPLGYDYVGRSYFKRMERGAETERFAIKVCPGLHIEPRLCSPLLPLSLTRPADLILSGQDAAAFRQVLKERFHGMQLTAAPKPARQQAEVAAYREAKAACAAAAKKGGGGGGSVTVAVMLLGAMAMVVAAWYMAGPAEAIRGA